MRTSVRMLRLAGIMAAIAICTSATAFASPIFSETFDTLIAGDSLGAAPYSQRAPGDYLQIVSLPGWSMTAGVYAFEYGSGNFAVLLNESGGHSISRVITGLTLGQSYDLFFQYWGDNVPAAYSFNVTINGATTSFNAMGVSAPTGEFFTVDIPFVAGGTSTTLTFQETSGTQASPIIDNILIDSPEPATALLAGCAIGLLALVRRRRLTR
jgi:hypothetical protein